MVNKQRITEEFIELVSVPCQSKKEGQIAELIKKKLTELGINFCCDDAHKATGGECGNILAVLPATAGLEQVPGIFFEAHMDSVDPATGTHVVRKDGVLYSDGTTTLGGDDKVGIAAMLELIKVLQEEAIPHGKLELLFTISEEIGCLGARNLQPGFLTSAFGYCLDDSGHLGDITYASPYQYVLDVKVGGKSAHAGLEPEKGISAVMLSARALAALPAYGRLDEETTLNVGLIRGGLASNIVAPACDFVIDMRSLNKDKLDKLRADTEERLRTVIEAGQGTVEITLKDFAPGVLLPMGHPCLELAGAAAGKLGVEQVNFQRSGGCSDGNFFTALGVPTAVLGTGMSNIHTTAEYLREEDLVHTARWAVEIARLAGEGKA